MSSESENDFRFILENILEIEDSSRVTIEIINIIEGLEWRIADSTEEIIFLSKNFKCKGSKIKSPDFRKVYTGAARRKIPIMHLLNQDDEVSGAFSLKAISKVWKMSIREKLVEIQLIPFEEEELRAKFIEIEFQTGIFQIRSIHQLFPTENYFESNIQIDKSYAKAYARYKELVPFITDRIIDLLSTDEIAPTFETWEKDPVRYDLPNVDTADITLARKLVEELPWGDLEILVKNIREIMTETEWEEYTDRQTIERYSQFLKYVKKIRRAKRKEEPEDYSIFIDDLDV
ncbi:MAG: hypothetical protein KAS63_10440 [Candidatus Heimdallarchaeota archaeon]|nr:hypothetical protein [Candidatus Heimdallarchaeota archaeon]MCK4955772.1 hypothetical protein [Candidatus Heimdallarchaeota archaeon]